MAFEIQDMQKVKLTAKGASARGNIISTPLPNLVWSSSDTGTLALANAVDQTVYAEAVGPLGSATIRATSDSIFGEIVIGVTVGPLATIVVEAAAPEPL